ATVLAALLWFPSTSSEARAGCGDYVHLGRGEARSGTIADGVDAVAGLGSLPDSRQPASPPCRGPSCRQRPDSPTAPAPVPASHGGDQKACLAPAAEIAPGLSECVLPEPAIPFDDFRGRQIERPPRQGS
ncbi:MAG: hypothetical protein ACM3U2_17755, partial [Deltaproteobacteria bacterium]